MRIARSGQHLSDLARARQVFLQAEERAIIGQFEKESNDYVFRMSGNPPEPEMGVLVGEFAHQLRASLDNLLWQVVLLRGDRPGRHTQFPICSTEQSWKTSQAAIKGVNENDRATIEQVQPFQWGEETPSIHPLARLTWLNNRDKHRLLHVGYAVAAFDPKQAPPGVEDAGGTLLFGKEVPENYFPWMPEPTRDVKVIESITFSAQQRANHPDPTEMARVRIVPDGPNPELKLMGGETVDLGFGDADPPINLDELNNLRRAAIQVVEKFEPSFKHNPI